MRRMRRMRRQSVICPSCDMRHSLPAADISPNYAALPISEEQWFMLRKAAESFDRAASNLDSEEGHSGTGDGVSLFLAADFIEFIKPDCIGFRPGKASVLNYESDGQTGDPFPLPYADMRRAS